MKIEHTEATAEDRELNQAKPEPVDRPVRTARIPLAPL